MLSSIPYKCFQNLCSARTSTGRLGLAGQISGRSVNPAIANNFLNSIPNPGSFEMNANKSTSGRQIGEISDIMPSSSEEIRALKAKGAY
jgi:hypothetical protein